MAARVHGHVIGDGSVAISGISAVGEATEGVLTFATSEQYFAGALAGKAAAVLVDSAFIEKKPRRSIESSTTSS